MSNLEFTLFERLPEWRKVEELNRNGILLAKRYFNGNEISLYTIGNFFVERWSRNQIEIIGQFYQAAPALSVFEPYLDGVDVESIS